MVVLLLNVVLVVIFVPPLEDVYQPLNVFPVLVAVGNVPIELPLVMVFDDVEQLPPFALNVIVMFVAFGVNCA